MALSDSDSSSDEESDDEGPGALNSYIAHQASKKTRVSDYEAFADDDENTIAQKMKTILALRESLGMDDDVAWLAQQKQKEEEKKHLENMSLEEQQAASGDMMAKIREKHLAKQKALESEKEKEEDVKREARKKAALEAAAQSSDDEAEEEDSDDDEKKAKKKKKEKKEKKKKKEKAESAEEEVSAPLVICSLIASIFRLPTNVSIIYCWWYRAKSTKKKKQERKRRRRKRRKRKRRNQKTKKNERASPINSLVWLQNVGLLQSLAFTSILIVRISYIIVSLISSNAMVCSGTATLSTVCLPQLLRIRNP